jgi:RsiW-degrading membrane proteinase PrsW (M82 family)
VSFTDDLEAIILLVIVAMLPAILYLTWVRSGVNGFRERWGPLLSAFALGAFGATLAAALIEGALLAGGTSLSQAYPAPEFSFLNGNSSLGELFLVVVAAPFIEEGLKALAVTRYSDQILRLVDGPVFGASVGLGFGFFETFLYGLGAWATGGIVAGLALIIVRSLSSILLHGSSTAVFGYGYAEGKFGGTGSPTATHYFAAVGMHSLFNILASLAAIAALIGFGTGNADALSVVGLGAAILFAWIGIEYVRSLVQRAQYPGALAAHPKFRPPQVRSSGGRSS